MLISKVDPYREALEHVHFPTGRPTLEGVIRCLIVQFGVPSHTEPEVWRPVLAESERRFLTTARQPISGPS
jgi:hypothetical protein